MSVQIDQIFTARAENVWQFLHTAGQGCYIPAYQRPYAWDNENVDRLIDDVTNGLGHLERRSNAISFLGTIIAIHDTNLVTVKPVYQSEVAPRVMTLIDGQQRISTSVMMNMALHHNLSLLLKKLDGAEGEIYEWIKNEAKRSIADLRATFILDQTTGAPEIFRYYPRIIRAFDDVWSTKGIQAIYQSPIARLTWTYIQFIEGGTQGAFKYKVVDDEGSIDRRHLSIVNVFKYMQAEISALTGKKHKQYDIPNIQQAIRNDDFMKALWSYVPPESVVKYITEQSDDKQYDTICGILRSLIFHRYFNTRMALTVVTTRSEDDAFDMFEALNTTGEPLTAFETLKPKIIEAEGLNNYQTTPSYKSVAKIEEYLDNFKKADERQRATSELLIPFALAETGDKLQKNLSDQRRYLREYFDKLPSLDERRASIGSLANLSAFVRSGWNSTEDDPKIEAVGNLDDETGFCFQSLRALKHNVVVGPLCRFYDQIRVSSEEDKTERMNEFISAIKAVTAFSMLWRGAYGGTENIDSVYRTAMRDGSPNESILPLAKRPKGSLGAVSLSGFKRLLWSKLGQYNEKESWVKAASKVAIYSHSAVVAKFLLLVASDDATLDPCNSGLIIKGTKGLARTVMKKSWTADEHFTVEHIAPQATKAAGWEESLYEDPQTVDRLGNLMLLPPLENGYLGKRPWVHKRLIYRYLCAETPTEAEAIYASFGQEGLNIGKSGSAILAGSSYIHMCKAVSKHSDSWSLDVLDKRSTRIAELAYDRIIGWIKP